ncbi:hypothetical protein [Paraburkholderia fungorum]
MLEATTSASQKTTIRARLGQQPLLERPSPGEDHATLHHYTLSEATDLFQPAEIATGRDRQRFSGRLRLALPVIAKTIRDYFDHFKYHSICRFLRCCDSPRHNRNHHVATG